MVSRANLPAGRDRAQLILAGSILIAILLVGITVLLNSVVFTENVAGGNSIEVTGDVEEFDTEARRNARALTIRINHATIYGNAVDVEANLRRNLTNYSSVLAESFADTGSTYVNVSFAGTRAVGTRVVQAEDEPFQRNDANGTATSWDPVDQPVTLGWFVLNLNASRVSTSEHLRIEVRNGTGSTLTLTVTRDVGNAILVNTSVDGGTSQNATCRPSGGRMLLDVVDGTSPTSSCTVNATASLGTTIDRIRIENGDAAEGKFAFVVNESGLPGVPGSCSGATHPCESPALWEIGITSTYRTSTMSYENEQNVTVYDTP